MRPALMSDAVAVTLVSPCSAASAAANGAGPHARHHRRGNSDPFEYDEPKFQDEILAGLADSASDWVDAAPQSTKDRDIEELKAYSNPSSPKPDSPADAGTAQAATAWARTGTSPAPRAHRRRLGAQSGRRTGVPGAVANLN